VEIVMDSTPAVSLALPVYDQILTDYDDERRALWCYFHPHPRPTFNLALLAEIHDIQRRLSAQPGSPIVSDSDAGPIQYIIQASAIPGVFNLGGDLELFAQLIERRDRAGLLDYGHRCVDAVYQNAIHYGVPGMTTIALVQGLALGGGFESALSSNILVAERSARFGFPEILFNLFPGMGALNLLARRVNLNQAERLVASGENYTAGQLHEMGIVDIVADDGEGMHAVRDYIQRHGRSRNGLLGIRHARDRLQPIERDELLDICEIWVDTALRVGKRDLRTMQRVAAAQLRRVGQAPATPPEPHPDRSGLSRLGLL
jgi:DSF synthase